ncbi:MAG: iron-sulfur cluster biosynthesis transcriptional regulator SufR [Cyanobacteria bacterium J06621_8]
MTTTSLTSTKQNILQSLLKRRNAAARELAEELDLSPQAVRRHLNDLEADGLIEYQSVQQGMGRPQHLYQLSTEGRDRLTPQKYSEFAVSFLDTLAETAGQEQVGKVLAKQYQRKAAQYRASLGSGNLQQRISKLVQLRQQEGYMAELLQSPCSKQHNKFILVEHNCVIAHVAESYPSICGHELQMFAEVLSDCHVQRTQWIQDGEHRCGYSIEPK